MKPTQTCLGITISSPPLLLFRIQGCAATLSRKIIEDGVPPPFLKKKKKQDRNPPLRDFNLFATILAYFW